MSLQQKLSLTHNVNQKKNQKFYQNKLFWAILNDLVFKTCYQRNAMKNKNSMFGNYISVVSFDFLEFNPLIYNFKGFLHFLQLLFKSKKKILFFGLPVGLEKEFFQLVTKLDSIVYTSTTLKKQLELENCNFSNLRSLKDKNLGLIFFFNFDIYEKYQNILMNLDIPIATFVLPNSTIISRFRIDYPLFLNVYSFKGSVFCYNLFSILLKMVIKKKTGTKLYNHKRSIKSKSYLSRKFYSTSRSSIDHENLLEVCLTFNRFTYVSETKPAKS